ncbi:MAG: sulfite exporter TauE/SafE family protein [Lautropia sp.]
MSGLGAEPALFWVIAVLAVLLAGFSKASTGGGIAMLAVPMLSLLVAPQRAAAIMLPILCLLDLLGVWTYRRQVDRALLRQLMPGALLGIVIGALVFGIVDVRWVKGLLGAECIIFALHRLGAARTIAAAAAQPADRLRGNFWSTLSGFTSTLAHAGGPPLMQYLLPLKLDKLRLIATTVYFFAAVNYIKLVPYGMLGLLDAGNLTPALVLLPAVPVGYWIGYRFAQLIPERPFIAFINWSLLITGIKLLADGVFGW